MLQLRDTTSGALLACPCWGAGATGAMEAARSCQGEEDAGGVTLA